MKKKTLFTNALFVIKYTYSTNKRYFILKLISILVSSFLSFIPLIFTRAILNEITVNKDVLTSLLLCLAFGLATLFSNLFVSLINHFTSIQAEKTRHNIKQKLASAIMRMPYSEVESPHIRDFINLANGEDSFAAIIDNLTGIISGTVTLLGLATIISYIQPLILVMIVLVVILRLITDKKSRSVAEKYREILNSDLRKADYYNNVMISAEYGKEIRINSLKDLLLNHINEFLDKTVYPHLKKQYTENAMINFLADTSVVIQECVVYFVLGWQVFFKGMLIGDFSMYMTSINNFTNCLRGIISGFSSLTNNAKFAQEFRYIIENYNTDKESLPRLDVDFSSVKVEFRNVSFKYPGTENNVLSNVSLTINPYETLSIVGVNGAGKTTLVKLLCRLYQPDSGEILINDIPINSIPYDQYMEILGVVFQDFKMFAFSIAENIACNDEYDKSEIQKVIENSGLTNKINSLEKSFDTSISKLFDEEGMELSGGETQRLAISRTLYKSPSLVILDEPTAALDPIAEYDIYQKFKEMVDGKTAVFISHRLSSTRFTDKIAVFENGSIIEYGNHSELINIANGHYRMMFDMQAQYYIH